MKKTESGHAKDVQMKIGKLVTVEGGIKGDIGRLKKEMNTMGTRIQKKGVITGNCRWLSARFGVSITCPNGFVATGVCGSGRNDDCGRGVWTRMKCCKIN